MAVDAVVLAGRRIRGGSGCEPREVGGQHRYSREADGDLRLDALKAVPLIGTIIL